MSAIATTPESSITRRVAWISAANTIGFAMSFLTPLLLVRALSQSDFGVYKQIFQILATTAAMLNLQVASSAFYFVPRHPDKKPQVIANIIAFYGGIGLLVAALFAVYPGWVTFVFKTSNLTPHIPLLGLAILLWLISSNLEVIPLALGDVRTSALFIVIAQITKSGLMIVVAIVFQNVDAILWASILQSILQTTIVFYYLRRQFSQFSPFLDGPLLKAQLANSIPYGIGGIAQTVQGDLHNYFVSYYFSPALFAIYSVGCFQLPLLELIQSAFSSVLIPEMSQLEANGDRARIATVWLNAVRKLALLIVPAYAFMLVMRYELITFLFTKNYEASARIFAVYLFNVLLLLPLTGPIVRAFSEMRYFRLKLTLSLLPVTWVLLHEGIRTAGLMGAIVAVVCVRTLDTALTLGAVARRLGIKANNLPSLLPILKVSLAAVTAAAAAAAIQMMLANTRTIIVLAAGAIVFGAVYFAVALISGAFTAEDQEEMFFWRRPTINKG